MLEKYLVHEECQVVHEALFFELCCGLLQDDAVFGVFLSEQLQVAHQRLHEYALAEYLVSLSYGDAADDDGEAVDQVADLWVFDERERLEAECEGWVRGGYS